MATRSTISIKLESGLVETIYSHWDGYLKGGVGESLVKHYNTVDKVKSLIALGNISSLHELGNISSLHELVDIPEGVEHNFKHPYENVTVAYGRDRGEVGQEAKIYKDFDTTIKKMGDEYNYIFIDGEWFYTRNSSTNLSSVVDNL